MLDAFSLTVGGIAVEASTGTIVWLPKSQHPACRGGVDAFAHVAHHAAEGSDASSVR